MEEGHMIRSVMPVRKKEMCHYELLPGYAKCQNQLLQN